jgi:predicted O-methyltransferase YrrM
MIKGYASKAYRGMGAGICLFGLAIVAALVVRGIFPRGEPESWVVVVMIAGVLVAIALLLASAVVFAWGCCMYCKAKGFPAPAGIMGLVPFIGWAALCFLPDHRKDAEIQGFPVIPKLSIELCPGEFVESFMQIDKNLSALLDEVDALRNTRDDTWQIPRVEGELLYQIALAANAKLIVEVGTSYGFSGLFWAAALSRTSGVLHTIDISQKKFDASRQHFDRAGVGKFVVNHLGDAADELPKIAGPIDIVFLDGSDKVSSRKYFELAWPNLRRGGSVLTDNTKTHADELADYVRYVRGRTDVTSIDIPIGNGMEWTVKL